jgi:hypothetical protein
MTCAVLLAAALSSGNTEFDAVARAGAREIALRRAAAEIVANGPPAGALERAMLADPDRFEKAADARMLCRDIFKREARAVFAAKVKAIDERLGLKPSDSALLRISVDEVVERHFARSFEAERRSAVEGQAKGLVASTRPSERDFDALDDARLHADMLVRILKEQKTSVFEENRQFVSERMVAPVLADARREQKRQAEYLMRARCEAYAPSVLKRDLRARLEENVRSRRVKAADPAKAWGVFEGTFARSVDAAVERRTLGRLERSIDGFETKVDVGSVLKTIAENPSAHVRPGDSEAWFRTRYSAGILSGALAAAGAEAPAQEREEFQSYAKNRIGAAQIRRAVEQRLQKDVLPKWRRARAEAAVRQTAETWPSLEDGTWHPDPVLADETAARSDYAAAVRDWRRAKGMEPLAGAEKGRLVLEEAARRADVKVAAAFDLARAAIAAQNAIVEGCHKTVLQESRKRKDAFWTRSPDLQSVIGLLTRATENEWEWTRLATLWPNEKDRPANASEQHRELFPSVKRKIELLAKIILEEMEEKRPERERTPDKSDDKPLEIISISVERNGGKIAVELRRGGKTLERAEASSRRGEFEGAMRKITNALSDHLKLPR